MGRLVRSPDITIVGAGAIGAACAWQLAQAGLDVTMIGDASAPAASSVAAGMLAPVTEAEFGEEALLKLNLVSSELYPGFIEELNDAAGVDLGYRRCGTLMVARDSDDNRVLEQIHAFQRRLGLAAQRLSGRAARELEPVLAPRTRGAILVEDDHQIDPSAFVDALRRAAVAAGVEERVGHVVEVGRGFVRLEDGTTLSSGKVVVAAGSYTGTIRGIAEMVPVRPVKGQLVHLRARRGALLPTRNIRGLDVYVVTRADGRVVVGASVEEQGFDVTRTAGAVHDLLREAYAILPGITELEFVGVTAGLRPATPDNAPVIGEIAPDVIVATGHYRNGILLTPITARAVAALVDGRSDEVVASFGAQRFATEGVAG
ncbi:MAG: glycine oxidase ThiO [Actinobacteria bacterium]|nr:glycine oxidase ThiO [Actinomycetota bacterium]